MARERRSFSPMKITVEPVRTGGAQNRRQWGRA
jgi:hypothetical protein